jgi:hypothetical protein
MNSLDAGGYLVQRGSIVFHYPKEAFDGVTE